MENTKMNLNEIAEIIENARQLEQKNKEVKAYIQLERELQALPEKKYIKQAIINKRAMAKHKNKYFKKIVVYSLAIASGIGLLLLFLLSPASAFAWLVLLIGNALHGLKEPGYAFIIDNLGRSFFIGLMIYIHTMGIVGLGFFMCNPCDTIKRWTN